MITRSFLQSHEDQEPFIFSEDLDEQNDGFQELSQEDEPLESRSDLISIQKKSFLSYLVRGWHSAHLITRLAWWGIKHKSEVISDSLEDKTSTRLFWLAGEGIPLESWSRARWAYRIKNFIDSADFILSEMGAILLASLLLHDLMSYSLFPEERCSTSLPDILDGTAKNQISWTYHFGSDVIHEAAYWTWLGAILIPSMLGLSSVFLRNKQLRILETQDVIRSIEVALINLDKESLTFRDACLSLLPMSRLSRTLNQVKFILLWDGRKDNDQSLLISLHLKAALVNNLIELTESNYFLIRYRAMQLLAQVAASFHSENLNRFIEDPVHKAGLAQLRETILAKLRKEPINEASTRQTLAELEAACAQPISFEEMEGGALLEDRQRRGMARYFRWTLGDDTRATTQLFWIPSLLISAVTFYSVSRYLELIVKKLIDIAYYFHDKSVCENKGSYFKFLIQSERYECVACDWPFVNYQNSLTAQTCLEGLLQRKMAPREVGYYLSQLPSVPGINRVDLSQQDWSNWPVSEWEKFLLALEPMLSVPLELFNASGIVTEDNNENPTPTVQHILALTQLLTQINVTQFDISHQRLTQESFSLLLESFAYQSLNALYLMDANMTDISVSYLSELIASGFNLSDLHLAKNQIGDSGITQISQVLPNSSLRVLNVAHNLFSDLGLQKLGLGIQQSFLQSLDLSSQLLSVNGLRLFSDALKGNSSLSRLRLSHTGLADEHLSALQNCLENLEFLDVSDNSLNSKAIQFILSVSQQNLKMLIVNNNDLDEEASLLIAQELPMTSLEHLDLSKNYLREGFKNIIRVLPNSRLLSLVCEDCDLDDKAIAELTQVFSNDTLLLQSLNLNKNKITNQTLLNWLEVLPNTSLRQLHFNNNQISNSYESAPLLAQGLTKTNLTVLDLSSNRLDRNFFNELAPLLNQSSLQQLSLSDNKLETGSLKHFSEALVQLHCHRQDLNAPHLSRQEKRVFYPMKRNTDLNQLGIVNTDTDSSTLRGFCRVAASLPDVHFLESNHMTQLDWRTCQLLPANSKLVTPLEQAQGSLSNQTQSIRSKALVLGSPFLMSLLCAGGILCALVLFYGAYRASRSTYRFFRPAPSIARSESEENSVHPNLRRSSF
ncbi:hypothetical protein A1D18_00445 [Candidatus Rickettsiella isopodorum]|jgi:hypothetical protein|uniref:Uncharacterized protein n=1 Tax=Candidatus Rickettsiella isopodorum TaxID=1225476 RepID=A0A1J8NMK5_9COXI|nr:hypothetical protein [Candidatus Rickettsiella isopodorum]OIZ96320.1 hypothetical protein A1D18_00445 [Candidatus Rickettsiella isopodorum]